MGSLSAFVCSITIRYQWDCCKDIIYYSRGKGLKIYITYTLTIYHKTVTEISDN